MYPFIVFEGVDGCGKTTQSKKLIQWLQDDGYEAVLTREPGGSSIGGVLRQLLLNEKMTQRTETLLFAAERSQHVTEVIRPKMNDGFVICDRYIDSSGAYQSSSGVTWDEIQKINEWATDSLYPDLVFVVDLPVELSLQRMGNRFQLDKFESKSLEFMNNVRAFFLRQANENPDRYRIIDGTKSEDEVFADICREFNNFEFKGFRKG